MSTLIPKKVHYCWFGGKRLNKLGIKCLKSWKKYFPDYEIIEWNESNFDLNCCEYVKQAAKEKKWAFVSDYVRFKVLYEQGGIYFDTDVEVVKSFDDILSHGAYMGCENYTLENMCVNTGLGVAGAPGIEFFKEVLDSYETSSFYNDDGTLNLYTVVQRVTDLLKKYGLRDSLDVQEVSGITIYPAEYFSPKDMRDGVLKVTDNTHSIHHYSASWFSIRKKIYCSFLRMMYKVLGEKRFNKLRDKFGKKE